MTVTKDYIENIEDSLTKDLESVFPNADEAVSRLYTMINDGKVTEDIQISSDEQKALADYVQNGLNGCDTAEERAEVALQVLGRQDARRLILGEDTVPDKGFDVHNKDQHEILMAIADKDSEFCNSIRHYSESLELLNSQEQIVSIDQLDANEEAGLKEALQDERVAKARANLSANELNESIDELDGLVKDFER